MHAAGSEVRGLRPCGAHLPRGSAVCPGQVPAFSALLHLTSRVSWVHGVRGLEQRTTGCIFSGSRMSPRRTHHPPFAPAHGSSLTLHSEDFRYWLRFLSLFGDSEFPEGRNHDFLSFFPMVLCWRDTQQVVEWMSGWMNEWGSTNGSSSVGSSLIDSKLLGLAWKASTAGLQPT